MAKKNHTTPKHPKSAQAALPMPPQGQALLKLWEAAFADVKAINDLYTKRVKRADGLPGESIRREEKERPALYFARSTAWDIEDQIGDLIKDTIPTTLEEMAIFMRYFVLSGNYRDHIDGCFRPFDDAIAALCRILAPMTGVASAFE